MTYLSSCIANLGVVPLFLLAAFLLVPCFFLLFFLITLSCFVFEAIISTSIFRSLKITHLTCIVKMILASTLCCYAEDTILISKGEQTYIKVSNISHFSIGNKEVISSKLLKSNKFYIKGKRMGYSDLLIWHKNKTKSHYHIYVLSKKESLKLAQISKSFESMNLKTTFQGKALVLTGEIDKLKDHQKILSFKKIYKEALINDTTLSKKLQKEIISNLYTQLIKRNIKDFICTANLNIHCSYSFDKRVNHLEKKIQDEMGITLSFYDSRLKRKNFKLSIKLVEIQRSDGKEISLGLHRLNSLVTSYLKTGSLALVNKNSIRFFKENIQIKTIAEPVIITSLNESGSLNLGTSIPFVTNSNNASNTNWKNTGLTLNYLIKSQFDQVQLQYSLNSTQAQGPNIAGGKFKATRYARLNNKYESLFHIALDVKRKKNVSLPVINLIPVLGVLFRSQEHVNSYKYIFALYKIEEIDA